MNDLTKKYEQYCSDIIDSSYIINEEGEVQIDLESTDKVCKVMHTYAEVAKEDTARLKVKAETTVDCLANVFDVVAKGAVIAANVLNLKRIILCEKQENLMLSNKALGFISKTNKL